MKKISLHIGWLDELRGFSVLLVLAYHCLFWPFKRTHLPWQPDGVLRSFDVPFDFLLLSPLTLGWGGVAVFFVISGFCIHLSYLKDQDHVSFYWKRFWRICPPYFVALFLFFGADVMLGQVGLGVDGAQQLLSHLLMVHNFWKETHYGINPSFWSIAVEVQLYLIYPVLLFLSDRLGWKTCLFIALAFEIVLNLGNSFLSQSGYSLPRVLTEGPFAYWFSWSIGAWLAHQFRAQIPVKWPRILSPLSCVLLVLVASAYKPVSSLAFLFVALLTASVIARNISHKEVKLVKSKSLSSFGSPLLAWSLLRRFLAFAGVISYSLYLLHQPIISLAFKLLMVFPGYRKLALILQYSALLGASLVLALIIAWAFYVWIERPSVGLGSKLRQWHPPAN